MDKHAYLFFGGRSCGGVTCTVFARRGRAALDDRFFKANHFEFFFPVGMDTTTAPCGDALM